MIPELAIACVKWGPKYGPDYVHRLASMVLRHLAIPFRFVCFTDDATGLACETLPLPPGLRGWWNKLVVFAPAARQLAQRILMLDLDVVITGPLDCLLDSDAPLALTMDWMRAPIYNGAAYLLETGAFPEVWENFKPEHAEQFWGDQEWMTHCIPSTKIDFWPAEWIASYKMHGQNGVPPRSKVVCFHGQPKPHEILGVDWVRENWR